MVKALILLSLMNAGDAYTTKRVIHDGWGIERDPFARPFVRMSTPEYAASVAAGTALEAVILSHLHRKHPRLADTITFGAIGVEGVAISHNAKQLTELP
jgi:hypothetical protein